MFVFLCFSLSLNLSLLPPNPSLCLSLQQCLDTLDPSLDPNTCLLSNSGAFSVLRSFRLVRILRIGKLVRMFPQIQRQLKVISKTLSTVSSLIALIALFLLIFAILGMNLFGNLAYCELDTDDVDGVPFFRKGAFARALVPGKPGMNTVQITSVNQSHSFVTVRHWVDGKEEDVYLIEDRWTAEFDGILKDLNQTMIVGLAPRDSFDDFWSAFLTVFQLLTTSDIGDAMYPALRGGGELTVVYFIMITVIGNFMLFNLFVAIIITGFSENKADILKEEKENQVMLEQDALRKGPSMGRGQSIRGQRSIRSNQSLSKAASIKQGKKLNSSPSLASEGAGGAESFIEKITSKVMKMMGYESAVTADVIRNMAESEDKSKRAASDAGSTMEENWSELPLMRKVIENKYWNWFIIVFISLSCVSLVLQRPGMPQIERNLSTYLNLACNFVFIAEMLWKVKAYSWRKYIRNRWNQLDFFLVVISIIDMIGDTLKAAMGDNLEKDSPVVGVLGFLRNFRAFRALRPLRILSRAKGLKIVLGTLSRAIGPVLNTVAIAITAFFIFGIMSVQVLGGRLKYCSDIHVLYEDDCVGVDPMTGVQRTWLKRQLQYHAIGPAMLSMFVLASQDNWEMHMYAAIDATTGGMGPIANNIPITGLFFIGIMIVASFFVMQLFVGVFIDTFQTVTQEAKALGRKQSLASDNSSATSGTAGEEPIYRPRAVVWTVVTTKQFDLTIAAFILGNIVSMSADSAKSSSSQSYALGVFEFVFNFVFGTEVIAKEWGLYPKMYFNSKWNKFDFAVVMVSYIGIAIDNLGSAITQGLDPTLLRVLRIVRVFRILRAFRIFKAAQGLQNLVRTLLRSLTAVGNLAGLLLLLFFVIGVLCVELFGFLCIDNFQERNSSNVSRG